MLAIAVCDDELLESVALAGRIKKIMEKMKISCSIRQFNSGTELLQASEQFDLVFLDIMMKHLNGMKTAELFREKMAEQILIFVSSSREYVFDAYDVEAFSYLVKPVEEEKLQQVLKRAVLKLEDNPRDFIIMKKERQKKKLFLSDIYYIEVRGRTVDVHKTDGIFTCYEKLESLENNLRRKGFFRCHKSYLINLSCVEGYNRQEVILENGERIPVAKRRYEEFGKEMLNFMRKNGGVL